MAYISGDAKPGAGECPFCRIPSMSDEDGLIVAPRRARLRRAQPLPVQRRPPAGRPVPSRRRLHRPRRRRDGRAGGDDQAVLRAVRETSGPQGFNVGLNHGVAAGAGIAPHLHQHVVPRWGGDSNFMPVIGHTKVLPQLLGETRELLVASWQRLGLAGKTVAG